MTPKTPPGYVRTRILHHMNWPPQIKIKIKAKLSISGNSGKEETSKSYQEANGHFKGLMSIFCTGPRTLVRVEGKLNGAKYCQILEENLSSPFNTTITQSTQ